MTNPYEEWHYFHTTDSREVIAAFLEDRPKSVGFDTETTGLHIKKDKPFLIQLGWSNTKKVFTFEPTKKLMETFFKICQSVKWVFGHNVVFDINMLANIGYEDAVQNMKNLCDTQAIMRLALEAKSARDGGDTLALKDLGVKYIHPYAANSENLIKAELKRMNDERVKFLAAALKQFPMEGEFTATGRQKYWGKGAIEKFMKNITNDISDLPEGVRDVWLSWQEEYPEPTYADVDRELMYQYGGEDVATTLMLAEYGMQIIQARNQREILQIERDCLLPKYRMERIGLKVDKEYLEKSRLKMKAYIIQLRTEMEEICGEPITVNQHERIKSLYDEKWGIVLESSDKQTMRQIRQNFEGEPQRLATLINTLRTAEKWYTTYIVRTQRNAEYDGRAYTQINLNGAISGRMSSDFQQFPRDPFRTLEGEELFHARQAFVVDGGEYSKLSFIDYSQIELRVQGHYTILTSGGDLNLLRAYMPFKCHHYKTGEEFAFKTKEQRSRWSETGENGDSVWIMEDGKPWIPIDLHTTTASKAYPNIPIDSEEFEKDYRPKGKATNFASNYGAGPAALVALLGISWEEAETLINGYNEAFPGVIKYQEVIVEAHRRKGYVHNHYGRRYYLKDNRDAYKLSNYVVQGSCADALKKAIIEMDKFLADKKTKMVLPVHDEQIFAVHVSEQGIEEELKAIMIRAFDWCLVPVNVGIDTSTTNWRDAG